MSPGPRLTSSTIDTDISKIALESSAQLEGKHKTKNETNNKNNIVK